MKLSAILASLLCHNVNMDHNVTGALSFQDTNNPAYSFNLTFSDTDSYMVILSNETKITKINNELAVQEKFVELQKLVIEAKN